MDIEVWSEVIHPRPVTRNRPAKVLERTQHASIVNNRVIGAPLVLEFENLMRRRCANPLETDLIRDAASIRRICEPVEV